MVGRYSHYVVVVVGGMVVMLVRNAPKASSSTFVAHISSIHTSLCTEYVVTEV